MPRAVAQTVWYYCWRTSDRAPITGDVANHTLRFHNGTTSAAPSNSPFEADATYQPGVYGVLLTASETNVVGGVLSGISSTSGVEILPTYVNFEQVPTTTTIASSLGVSLTGPTITAYRSSTWTINITDIGDISDRDNLYFTIKDSAEDGESEAIIQIDENNGLLRVLGDGNVTEPDGSIVVTDPTDGDITVTLAASVAALLTSGRYVYDVKKIVGSASYVTPKAAFVISRVVTQRLS